MKQFTRKLHLVLTFRGSQKVLFNPLPLLTLKFIPNVLIRDLVDYSVKMLAKRRIREQTQFQPLLILFSQLPEKILSYLVFIFFNDVRYSRDYRRY